MIEHSDYELCRFFHISYSCKILSCLLDFVSVRFCICWILYLLYVWNFVIDSPCLSQNSKHTNFVFFDKRECDGISPHSLCCFFYAFMKLFLYFFAFESNESKQCRTAKSDHQNVWKILTAIYQMLSTGEEWNPSNLYKIDMPVALVEKQKAKAIRQAKKLLQREGTLPPDKPLAS